MRYFQELNYAGQEKALEQVKLLTQIPSYQAKIETSEDVPMQIDKDGNLTE